MTDEHTPDRRNLMKLVAGGAVLMPAVTAAARSRSPIAGRRRVVGIGNVRLGEGASKTIVSIATGGRAAALARAVSLGANPAVDVVEIRADHLVNPLDAGAVAQTAAMIRRELDKPLIFTFRSKREGGETAIDDAVYAALYQAVLAAKGADLIDLEVARIAAAPAVAAVLRRARAEGVFVIGSAHNFDLTPPVAQMVAMLRRAQTLGADIPKIAVMPHDPADVLHLLEATWTFVRDEATGPVITMSMDRLGGVSRLAGTAFGSAASFGSDGAASAPGQLSVAPLHAMLQSLDGEQA